jgi:hypothetical protein
MKFIGQLAMILWIALGSSAAHGQSTEEKFQDLFTTAGYAGAFGAALGASALAFKTHPENHLRYIAVGASLGFIGGTAIGSYIIFSPTVFADDQGPGSQDLFAGHQDQTGKTRWLVSPSFNAKSKEFAGFATGFALNL